MRKAASVLSLSAGLLFLSCAVWAFAVGVHDWGALTPFLIAFWVGQPLAGLGLICLGLLRRSEGLDGLGRLWIGIDLVALVGPWIPLALG